MSRTATARSELLPLHSTTHAHGGLLPSPMPRPTSSVALKSPFKMLDATTSAEGAKSANRQDWSKLDRTNPSNPRTALARVNPNINTNTSNPVASTSAVSTLHKRPINKSTAKAIPRPPATPDVFAEEVAVSASRSALGKRARETSATSAVKRSRADAAKAAAKSHRELHEAWLAKWQKVFPTLVFHFEIGVEDGIGRGLRSRVTNLGAHIDPFFSQRVSHLIVKGNATPQKRSIQRKGKMDPDNPFLDPLGEIGLVAQAEKLGIKVWPVKKLADMVDKLDPVAVVDGDSLSNLLAHEKLHGTRERDFSAPRPDYYYFKPGYKYLLVEDATGRNRPIMVKEYSSKDKGWPVVHEQFLKFPSSHELPHSVEDSPNLAEELRARATMLYVEQMPFRGEQPPAPSLKRSSSLRDIAVTPLPEALPYDKASGNSVVLTSNIASTSAANHTPGYVNGMPQLGQNRDRAIMQMSKRVQVLKGNARMAAGKKAVTAPGQENRMPESVARLPGIHRRKSTGMKDIMPPAPAKEFLSQAQVVSMLKQLRGPTSQTKPTCEERLDNHAKVAAGLDLKEQDTANGYCENCRVRYPNLSIHMASKKHRRFAENPDNFADLDDMLQCIQRPPNPIICVPTKVCRPCNKPHGKDEACGRCMDDPELFSSPAPSSQPGSMRREYTSWRMSSDEREREPLEPMGRLDVEAEVEAFEEAAEAADCMEDE